jgi:hypothetical protein
MKNMSGLMLSEITTYIMLTMIVAAVAFGFYVSSERDGVVEAAEKSLAEIQAVVEQAEQSGGSIACDSSLVSADILENEFLSLVIRPMPLDAHNLDKGYGVGVFVESKKEEDGNDTFVVAERLQEALAVDPDDEDTGEPEFTVRLSAQDEDEIAYGVLVSNTAICTGGLAANP